MADAELDVGGLNRTLKDLFSGAMGGIAQVLIGQWKSCLGLEMLLWSRVGHTKRSQFVVFYEH